MPMLDRPGRFRVEVVDAGILAKSKLACIFIKGMATEEAAGEEFVDVSHERNEITAFVYLEKKDGTVNTAGIKSLRNAFPDWNGTDLEWFDNLANSRTCCQFTVEWDTYNNKKRLKVQWVNHVDDEGGGGGLSKASEEERRALKNRLAAKLRSNAGGTAVPPRPAAPPAAPSAPKAPPAAPARAAAPSEAPRANATEAEAWAYLSPKFREGATEEEKAQEWFHIIELVTGKTDAALLTPADWAKVINEGASKIVPF